MSIHRESALIGKDYMSDLYQDTQTLTLPNGILLENGDVAREIEIRQLDGDDEDMIRNKENLRKGNAMDLLLKRCIIRVGNDSEQDRINQLYDRGFMLADLTFTLIKLRMLSVDTIYAFSFTCPTCSKINKQRLDLSQLTVDEQDAKYRGQAEFMEELTVNGRAHHVKFRPIFARDAKMMEIIKSEYPTEKGTRELLIQLLEFDGQPATPQIVKKMSWKMRNEIRNLMDGVSGGIDVELLMDCPKCDATAKDSMPLEVRDFFYPGADTSNSMMTAVPYRASGITSLLSQPNGDGTHSLSESSL